MRIGIKITCSLALIVSIFSGALLLSINESRQAMIDETGSSTLTFARDVLDRLDQRIHDSISFLRIVAIDPDIQKLVIESNNEYDEIKDVDNYISEKSAEWHSYEGKDNPMYNEMVKNQLSQRLEILRQTFHESNGVDIFPEIFVTNKYGATIAENNRLTDWDQSDRLQFQNTRDYGVHVSDLYFDKSAGVWALEIAVAVKDGNEFAGMVKTAYNIEDIVVLLDSSKETQYETSQFLVITGDDRSIYFSDGSFDIGNDMKQMVETFEMRELGEGTFFGTSPRTGENIIGSFSTSDGYRDFKGLDWIVGISILEEEFLSGVNQLQNILLGIMIVSIIVGVVVGVNMIRGIVPPIKKIEKAAKQISQEKFEEKIEIKSKDEIGSLGRSINEMATKLKDAQIQKDEFASMITHELKTPLVPIRGYCEMLKNPKFGELNEDQLDAIKEIEHHSAELLDLIQKILNAQKLELHKIKYKITDIGLDEYMKNKQEGLQSMMKDKNIEFVNSTESGLTVKADVAKLNEIFTNLVSNSVDFVPDSGGRIEINANDTGKDIQFFIKDNGEGISKDKQAGLFKKFYQVDTTATRRHGGSGLGLAICIGYVEGMNGKMWLESDKGKGATFFFTLPKA